MQYPEYFWTLTFILPDPPSWLQIRWGRTRRRCFYSGNLCNYITVSEEVTQVDETSSLDSSRSLNDGFPSVLCTLYDNTSTFTVKNPKLSKAAFDYTDFIPGIVADVQIAPGLAQYLSQERRMMLELPR